MENNIHLMLIRSTNIFQAERHHNPFVCAKSTWAPKGRFMHIGFDKENLAVVSMSIHKGENLMNGRDID